MAQITSREELEAWLKDKPADWAQVIAARAALRALPYSLLRKQLIDVKINHANIVFRDAIGVCTKLTHTFLIEGTHQSAARKFLVRAAHELHDIPVGTTYSSEVAALTALRAVNAAIQLPDAVVHDYTVIAYSACVAFDDPKDAWRAVGVDAEWLHSRAIRGAMNRLNTSELWHGEQPGNLAAVIKSIQNRLFTLDPSYQVWIDWYNRRIEGHDAAFDIPGDSDRTHDKAILARLADATDEEFWGKGATYVNTTLQSWIDEAREQAAIDYVASGAPLKLGSAEELAARPELLARFAEVEAELAKLKDQRASLVDSGHGQIGHNLPKGAGSLRDEEIAFLTQRVAEFEAIVLPIGAALAKLKTVVPEAAAVPTQAVEAVAELVVHVPELNLWQRAMQPLEDRTSPEVRKGFESAVGASLLSIPYIAYVTLPEAIRAFLHYFYTVWFPILPG